MISLGIDTTTEITSIGLVDGDNVLYALNINRISAKGEILSQIVKSCLKSVNIEVKDIQNIGVAVGPGSFTGLRIGISFIKGFCMVNSIPVVPYSTLKLMCVASGLNDVNIRAVMDARRNELFAGCYSCKDGDWVNIEQDKIVSVDSFLKQSSEYVIGKQEIIKKYKLSNLVLDVDNYNLGLTAAKLAASDKKNEIPSEILKPNYFRKSAAEERLVK